MMSRRLRLGGLHSEFQNSLGYHETYYKQTSKHDAKPTKAPFHLSVVPVNYNIQLHF